MVSAVALYSGGLDSTLAVLSVLRQGVKVKALTFLNHFGCEISDRSSCSKNPFSAAEQFGFEVKLCHLSDKFINIVKNPKFGHGKNMNPCIDCRILMLREAKEFMEMSGAAFIVTGEVLGQRPMSQRRDALDVIDREAGLRGYVLRPLSARRLKPTTVEERGIVDRNLLYDFTGRSRKPQIALAREFGLRDYPAPAGGCLLTEPNYSFRLQELLSHEPDPSVTDLNLLRTGRHFRLASGYKVIVGRNMIENDILVKAAKSDTWVMKVLGYGSPVTIAGDDTSEDDLMLAAAICARYSDARHLLDVDVRISRGVESFIIQVQPADDYLIEEFMIEMEGNKKNSATLHR